MKSSINRIVIYTKKMAEMVTFYETHFDFKAHYEDGDRIIELLPINGGISLMLHPAGKGMKEGQASVKLVFDVEDVKGFCEKSAQNGLVFGSIHKADGYNYANAKDPSKNSIQISSRVYRA